MQNEHNQPPYPPQQPQQQYSPPPQPQYQQQYPTPPQYASPPQYVPYPPPHQKKSKVLVVVLIILIVVVLLATAVIISIFADTDNGTAVDTGGALGRDVELTPDQIFADNVDAVFKIYTYDWNGDLLGWGSGFFVSPAGVAVTNHHVIIGAPNASIMTEDGRAFDIVGYYAYCLDNDLAIIQVDGRGVNFPYLALGNSDALRVGESVFTIGSPHGQKNTFSRSYISNFVSQVAIGGGQMVYTVNDLIQITAPILSR
ncbi:MAG: S1C family serine protease [Oscillospiraceae bacterium]|nr:S1C family serine protease [Oscillospiraceae bacterium]